MRRSKVGGAAYRRSPAIDSLSGKCDITPLQGGSDCMRQVWLGPWLIEDDLNDGRESDYECKLEGLVEGGG